MTANPTSFWHHLPSVWKVVTILCLSIVFGWSARTGWDLMTITPRAINGRIDGLTAVVASDTAATRALRMDVEVLKRTTEDIRSYLANLNCVAERQSRGESVTRCFAVP